MAGVGVGLRGMRMRITNSRIRDAFDPKFSELSEKHPLAEAPGETRCCASWGPEYPVLLYRVSAVGLGVLNIHSACCLSPTHREGPFSAAVIIVVASSTDTKAVYAESLSPRASRVTCSSP